jgi:hypothetical protein
MLKFSTVIALVALASPLAAQAADFGAQFSQASEALTGSAAWAEIGNHFYQGLDRRGQACLVTVQYGPGDIDVEVKAQGAGPSAEELFAASIPARSKTITSMEVNSNEQFFGVAIEELVTPHGSSTADHYAYRVRAELDGDKSGLGRLSSVSVWRNEKGKESSADCGSLKPVLALSQADVASLADSARAEYLRRNPGDSVGEARDADVQSCVINDASSVTCDVSLTTDYTPDTLHVTLGIRGGRLGAIRDIDFEPGC